MTRAGDVRVARAPGRVADTRDAPLRLEAGHAVSGSEHARPLPLARAALLRLLPAARHRRAVDRHQTGTKTDHQLMSKLEY